MNTPLWYLMARLTVFSGSTGWFRGFLIDTFVQHTNEWWLYGSKAAMSWHPFLMDVTNQYVAEGLDGGLPAMALFIAILTFTFRYVGRTIRNRDLPLTDRRLIWGLGAALGAHAISFISVSYFDQTLTLFLLTLAGAGVGLNPGFLKVIGEEASNDEPAYVVAGPDPAPFYTRARYE
jgi:hypothetical protein